MPTYYINHFSNKEKVLDVGEEKLINVIGKHVILDQYLWMSVMPYDMDFSIDGRRTLFHFFYIRNQ